MNQGLVQRQELLLQPRMLQSIEVLQLPLLELEGWLSAQAEQNEALLVEPPERDRPRSREATEAHDEMLRNQPGRPPALAEVVEEQLVGRDLEPDLIEWVRFLVGCLDSGGYLSPTDEELEALAEEENLPLAGTRSARGLLGRAIGVLQDLEPRGLGARNAIEALLLQLDPSGPDYRLLCALLEEFVEELAKNRLPSVARAMGLELEDLRRLLSVLGELDPRPASRLVEVAEPPIHPDLVVEPEGEAFRLELVRSALPSVQIDPTALELAGAASTDRETRRYLRAKIEKARWVTDAVEQRGATLLRVARAVFEHQGAFLERGRSGLVPLSMTELAAGLKLATSTVSRAVAGKYVQTPWDILPLREFFQTAATEDGPARDVVRDRVEALVEGEDPAQPLSDEDIAESLRGEGIDVARRTVAKYRKELDIPTSYKRRRHV